MSKGSTAQELFITCSDQNIDEVKHFIQELANNI